jgi:MFS family permease
MLLLQVIAFFLAGITAVSTGIDMFVSTFIDIPVQREWDISSVEYGLSPSTTCVANIIGGFLYSFLIDSYGRVWPYALALVHLGLVGLASAFSPSFMVFLTLGNVASLALPAISSVLYTTLVEFLPVRNRGKIVVSVLVVQAVGACITGGLAWWLIPTYTERGWRYLVIATAIPKFISAAYRLFIFPLQSPRFLIAKGRLKEARKIFETMAWLNRKNLDDILPKDKNIVCTNGAKNVPV